MRRREFIMPLGGVIVSITTRASPSKGRLMRYTVPGSTLNTT